MVRLLPDGAFDPSFLNLTLERGFFVSALARHPDGLYLCAGVVDAGNAKLFRLNVDGTLDPSFAISADLFLPGESDAGFASFDVI